MQKSNGRNLLLADKSLALLRLYEIVSEECAQSLTRLNELGDQRRLRLLSSRAGMPGLMWVVLLGAGVVTVGFSLFFHTSNTTAQALMTAGLR